MKIRHLLTLAMAAFVPSRDERIRTLDAGTAMLYGMPGGVEGDVEGEDNEIETIGVDGTNPPLKFGYPVKMNSDATKVRTLESTDAGSAIVGILTRTAPSISGSSASGFNDHVPHTELNHGLIRRGRVHVKCPTGTPIRNRPVYARTVENGAKLVGDFEATEAIAATGTAAAMVGTGNATSGAVTVADGTTPGVYVALFSAATKFNLITPSGDELKQGTTGVAYSAGGLSFTITAGGTAAVAGDAISITVADTSENVLVPGIVWAVNGKGASNEAKVRVNL